MGSYAYAPFPYVTPPELRGAPAARRPVVIVGAGPVGLTCAVDLALHGIPVVVLDDSDVVSVGSRAICWSKRTLEIWDRLGVGQRMVDKGVTWSVGRVFHGDAELYKFDLLPEKGHRRPAFINLQQYYAEEYLVRRAREFPDLIDIRWKNEVTGLAQRADGAALQIATPDGAYTLEADWAIACDGARSPIRTRMGLAFEGQTFEERFLIADVRMKADFLSERLFWFEPEFHAGQSALLHKQPDNVFRIDFQLGPDADPEREKQPDRVMPRVRAVVGERTEIELEWCSVYSFRCARLEKFVHGRIIFAGDSAHVVSPFGARGGNGGIQDADNLCWKLARVIAGKSPPDLIDSYDAERRHGAAENIMNSSRTTNFMTPKTKTERLFRDATLALAPHAPFARTLLNAGRLSRPCSLEGFALQTPSRVDGGVSPGTACPDAPLRDADGNETWLLDHVGSAFTVLAFIDNENDTSSIASLRSLPADICIVAIAPRPLVISGVRVLADTEGFARERYAGATYLVRPDAHVAACFGSLDSEAILAAHARATGNAAARAREAA